MVGSLTDAPTRYEAVDLRVAADCEDRDLLEKLVESGSVRGVVGDVMSKKVIAVGASTTIREAARRMVAERIHRVIVVSDAGALLGIVSTLDVVEHLSR